MLILVILSTVLFLVSLICIISAFARTVKEAGTLVIPLMLLVMLVGVMSMFSGGAQEQLVYYFIPCYNSVKSMIGIFSFNASALNVAITVAANLLATALCILVLTKMFSSERVIFNR